MVGVPALTALWPGTGYGRGRDDHLCLRSEAGAHAVRGVRDLLPIEQAQRAEYRDLAPLLRQIAIIEAYRSPVIPFRRDL